MTTRHYDIADTVRASLPSGDPLIAVLAQRSGAYGTVAGALETLAGASVRDQDTREAMRALVDAIHAPRAEAETIAAELFRLARNAMVYRHEIRARLTTW